MGVGYGPKLFQSVLRFQRLLNLAASAGIRRNLARFAADRTTADQAHMTPEVQRFSGNSPRMLLPSPQCALRLIWSHSDASIISIFGTMLTRRELLADFGGSVVFSSCKRRVWRPTSASAP